VRRAIQGRALTATVHLVRHGEVENPAGVIYGRLPGYHLSERGKRQAAEAANRLRNARVGAVWASPLERAVETADLIADPHGVEVVTDERLTESDTTFEGATRSVIAFLRSPRHWWGFRNPVRPSWGESFVEVEARMVAAVADAVEQAQGREVVVVSHQTPVRVARLALASRRIPPWLPLTQCRTGSVTSLVLDGGKVVSASYFDPGP
jgi:broad specificity phosphatase PhoE